MSVFERVPDFASFAHGFAPIVSLLNDHTTHAKLRRDTQHANPANKTWIMSPRTSDFSPVFDVRESSEAYELHGELPGVMKEDLSVEFSNEDTICISGNKERRYLPHIDEEAGNSVATFTAAAISTSDNEAVIDDNNDISEEDSTPIDAAKAGPKRGVPRNTIIVSKEWRRPEINIDASTHVHQRERELRRPSLVNARSYTRPVENIDLAFEPVRLGNARRPSIEEQDRLALAAAVKAANDSIDLAFQPPVPRTKPTSGVTTIGAPLDTVVETTIDGAKAYIPRSTNGVFSPRLHPASPKPLFNTYRHTSWLLSERAFGPFTREFKFMQPVDRSGIKASMKEGVLVVMVPKATAARAERMRIAVA